MRNRIVIIAALVCAAFALVVAGCGGGDDSSSTSSDTALSKDEFISKADAICKSGNDDVDAQAQQIFGNQQPTDEQVTQFVNNTLLPSIETEISGIEALTPPAGDEDQVQAIIDAVKSAVDEAKANPERLFAAGQDSPFADANQLAKAYGLKVCGQN